MLNIQLNLIHTFSSLPIQLAVIRYYQSTIYCYNFIPIQKYKYIKRQPVRLYLLRSDGVIKQHFKFQLCYFKYF